MNATPEQPPVHADLAWGRIAGRSESGSFIEDQLGSLVDGAADAGRLPVDVMHPDPARQAVE